MFKNKNVRLAKIITLPSSGNTLVIFFHENHRVHCIYKYICIQPGPSMTLLVYGDPSKTVYSDPHKMVGRITINRFRRITINQERH